MNCAKSVINYYFIIFLLQSTHMLLHQQGHCDGFLNSNHRQQLLCEADDSPNLEAHDVRHIVCRRTHSLGSPFDIYGIRPSNNLHQKVCYEQRVVIPLSEVQSAPILSGILVHRQYLHDRDHEPVNTNSYNSSALAGTISPFLTITTPTEHTEDRSLLAVSKSIAAKSRICCICYVNVL